MDEALKARLKQELAGFTATSAWLQFMAKQVLEGFCSGLHRSPHKGSSASFKQHRPYVVGDEIRRLDWKVFARSDRFYVREYEEETNLRASLLVDASGSMQYRGQRALMGKGEYARVLAAIFTQMLVQQQDGVGLVVFDTHVREFIPVRSRPGHLNVITEALARAETKGETDLSAVIEELSRRIAPRGLVVLFSDCLGEPAELVRVLGALRHGHHEVVVFHILDPDEIDFPFTSWSRFESLEISAEFVHAEPAALRSTYLENLRRFQQELQTGFSRNRVDLVAVRTDVFPSTVVGEFLTRRMR
jgi:uncharacterized protein (DUF58 family)